MYTYTHIHVYIYTVAYPGLLRRGRWVNIANDSEPIGRIWGLEAFLRKL